MEVEPIFEVVVVKEDGLGIGYPSRIDSE